MNKLSINHLKQKFNSNEWPEFSTLELYELSYKLTLGIHPNINWLQGHFPEQPIVAGVVQTHWAAKIAIYLFDIQGDVQQVDNLKFQNVILPNQIIELVLEFNAVKNAVKFCYLNLDTNPNSVIFSEGKIFFSTDNVQ